jgi:hypothetical protein
MGMITTTQEHLQQLLNHAAEAGATQALIRIGKMPATIKQTDAFKLYGRTDITRWVKEGLVKQIQDGDSACVRYDVMELEAVAKSSNRHTYLSVNER